MPVELMHEYISAREYAEKFGISERTARHYCAQGKIDGAFLTGKTWNIPQQASLPQRKRKAGRTMPLLRILREQMTTHMKGSIYHRTQVDFTYNSNHMEGSRLTEEQTRFIFETKTLGGSGIRVDDVIETCNHFRCIDYIIAHAEEKLTEAYIKTLHRLLKSSTSDSEQAWFAVGEYKKQPNEVGGSDTTPPEDVARELKQLLKEYNSLKVKNLDNILDFHVRFERIHPFQDGNGRVGRLLLFKECLAHRLIPFIITEPLKYFYYRGIQQWPCIPGYLRDTCLSAQDEYRALLAKFRINT